jgi:hypothetical protein
MFSSIGLCAVAFLGEVSIPATPTWMTDYGQAVQVGKKAGKPLAVFVSSGAEGYQQVSRGGALTPATRTLLAKAYVCVYADTTQSAGMRLAQALEITKRGLVISDRGGQNQAFHHIGELSDAELTRNLERFAVVGTVRTTESNATSRASYYPSYGTSYGAAPPAQAYQPAIQFRGGGRSC